VRQVWEAPPSKSFTHRALMAAVFAHGNSRLRAPLESTDTEATLRGLQALGVSCGTGPEGWWVQGLAGRPVPGGGTVELEESGTSMRFLAALAALGEKPSTLQGRGRLPDRPMEELLEVLERLGAPVRRPEDGRSLPLVLGGVGPLSAEGVVEVRSGRSSQFASALLLIGPGLAGGISLAPVENSVSWAYVDMTAQVLKKFGAGIDRFGSDGWRVLPNPYPGTVLSVEGDWSSASYLFAAAAILGGEVDVTGLRPGTRQPDGEMLRFLRMAGCRVRQKPGGVEVSGDGRIEPFRADISGCPDLAPTLAVLGLFCDESCRLDRAGGLRYKESDRFRLLVENLRRLGREVVTEGDSLVLPAGKIERKGGTIETGADHRIVMAFALAGLKIPGVRIQEPECVRKSFPGYWAWLEETRSRTGR